MAGCMSDRLTGQSQRMGTRRVSAKQSWKQTAFSRSIPEIHPLYLLQILLACEQCYSLLTLLSWMGIVQGGDPPTVLFPDHGGNLHAFTGETDCAVLDLFLPPYNRKEGGRRCHSAPVDRCKPSDSMSVSNTAWSLPQYYGSLPVPLQAVIAPIIKRLGRCNQTVQPHSRCAFSRHGLSASFWCTQMA